MEDLCGKSYRKIFPHWDFALNDQHFLGKGVLSQEDWKCVRIESCKDTEKSCTAFKVLVMRAALVHVQNRAGHRAPGSLTRPEEVGSLQSPFGWQGNQSPREGRDGQEGTEDVCKRTRARPGRPVSRSSTLSPCWSGSSVGWVAVQCWVRG